MRKGKQQSNLLLGISMLLLVVSYVLLPHFAFVSTSDRAPTKGDVDYSSTQWYNVVPGNFNLGAFFPLHSYNDMSQWVTVCDINSLRVADLMAAEAFQYAIQLANEKYPSYFQLGAFIADTCQSEIMSQVLTLSLLYDYNDQHSLCNGSSPRFIHALMGPVGSIEAANLVKFAEPNCLPIVSSIASSTKFNTDMQFFRTYPSDENQALVIFHLLKKFGWTVIQVVYTDDDYSSALKDSLDILLMNTTDEHDNSSICVHQYIYMSTAAGSDPQESWQSHTTSWYATAKRIEQEAAVTPVVVALLSDGITANELFSQMSGEHKIQWIGPDGWCRYFNLNATTALPNVLAAICIEANSTLPDVYKEFLQKNLTMQQARLTRQHPWLRSALELQHGCCVEHSDSCEDCPENGTLVLTDEGFVRAGFAVESVQSMQDAINVLLHQNKSYSDILSVSGVELTNALQKVRPFNNTGKNSGYPKYSIYQYQGSYSSEDPTLSWLSIGFYERSSIVITRKILALPNASILMDHAVGIAQPKCQSYQTKQYRNGSRNCWRCHGCKANETVTQLGDCATCPPGFLPVVSRSRCVSPWGLLVLPTFQSLFAAAALGSALCILLLGYIYLKREVLLQEFSNYFFTNICTAFSVAAMFLVTKFVLVPYPIVTSAGCMIQWSLISLNTTLLLCVLFVRQQFLFHVTCMEKVDIPRAREIVRNMHGWLRTRFMQVGVILGAQMLAIACLAMLSSHSVHYESPFDANNITTFMTCTELKRSHSMIVFIVPLCLLFGTPCYAYKVFRDVGMQLLRAEAKRTMCTCVCIFLSVVISVPVILPAATCVERLLTVVLCMVTNSYVVLFWQFAAGELFNYGKRDKNVPTYVHAVKPTRTVQYGANLFTVEIRPVPHASIS